MGGFAPLMKHHTPQRVSICSGDLASAPRVYFLNFAAASKTLAFVSLLNEDIFTRCSCSAHNEYFHRVI